MKNEPKPETPGVRLIEQPLPQDYPQFLWIIREQPGIAA
jgi:hypothetical protein